MGKVATSLDRRAEGEEQRSQSRIEVERRGIPKLDSTRDISKTSPIE